MKKNPSIRLVFIVILTLVFFIPLFPTVKWVSLKKADKNRSELKFQNRELYNSLSPDEQKKINEMKDLKDRSINLGLDLQGGMHIVLTADIKDLKTNEEKQDAINRALEIVRNRIDQFGVSEPSIMKQGENRIVVELPGVKDPRRAENLLNVRGKLEFKIVDEELSKQENFKDFQNGILKDNVVLPDDKEILMVWKKNKDSNALEKKYPVVLQKEAALTGAYLKTAGVDISQFGDAEVGFQLKSEGAEMFYNVTSANVGKQLAIILDGKVRWHPNIKDALRDRGRISGNFTVPEAKDLALILRAGATPVELHVMEKRVVGPSLGEDSINAGIKAAIIGFMLVILFMLIYYKFSGFIANITLFLNLFFLISILVLLKFTLTLPGLAGIILTIGMAVDANVLIFERIKEELRSGKSLRASVDAGFEKAFRAILDANITTLITAFILSQFGTGPIKGFAVTLFIGISVNLFTGVYVSHNIFNYIIDKLNLKKISI
ncbi:MAG: protein translocase subunit SecD [Spirochaetes bacterium]|nr:protein translocase subunit SecD [Spirochaetota bacterium]